MALTDSIVAYWKLDEASGTRYDSAGANNLTDYNTVGTATGRIGTAISYPAGNTNKYIGCADNDALSMGDIDFTIAGWWKRTDVNGQGQLVNKWDWNIPSREYLVDVHPSTYCRFGVATTGQSQATVADVFYPSIGDWTFLVAWHDASADTINIQVNARTLVSAAHSGGVNNGTAAFTIGPYSVLANYATDCDMDEIGIWKRVLTSDERATLYNSGAGLSYPFSGASAIPAFMNQYRRRRQ